MRVRRGLSVSNRNTDSSDLLGTLSGSLLGTPSFTFFWSVFKISLSIKSMKGPD